MNAELRDSAPPLLAFSKLLLPPAADTAGWMAAARALAAAGFTGIDLTVRPGGHVEPERAADELPRLQALLAGCGLRIGMLTTAITGVDSTARRVLGVAAGLGIGAYRLGYLEYRGLGTLRAQRAEATARFRELAALNRELGIHGAYHNHSDACFGANLADLAVALEGIERRDLGCYFDPCHAVIEGGSRGWVMGLDLVAAHVSVLVVKDFRWRDDKRGYAGARRHSVEFSGLAEGNTPWPEALAALRRQGFAGPVSFHGEYHDAQTLAELHGGAALARVAADVQCFASWWDAAGSQA